MLASVVALLSLVALAAAYAISVPNPGTATATSYAVNAKADYSVAIKTSPSEKMPKGSRITVTFPANFDASTITGVNAAGGGIASWSVTGSTLSIVTNAIGSNKTLTVTISGVTNPSQPGAYTLTGSATSQSGSFALSWPLGSAITAPATAVTVLPCVVDTSAVSVPSTYTVRFQVGALGRLAGTTAVGPNTITITFPSLTGMPASVSVGNVTINGVAPSAVSRSGQWVTLSMPAGMTVAANGAVTVVFAKAFGLVNPSVVSNAYTVGVSTSAQTAAGTSPAYTIGNYEPTNIILSSANQPPAGFVGVGDSVAVDGFQLQRTAGSQPGTVTAVTLADAGTTPSSAIAGVSVYLDNGSGTFDAGDTLLNSTPATFSGTNAAVTFDAALAQGFPDSTVRQYWVVYSFSSGVSDGWTASSQVATFTSTASLTSNNAVRSAIFTVDAVGPDVAWNDPAVDGTVIVDPSPTSIGGVASDAKSGVSSVGLQLRRDTDGMWWSGSAWSASPVTLPAVGTMAWGYDWSLLPLMQNGADTYTLYATATDAVGNVGLANVRSGITIDNTGPSISSAVAIDATHVDVNFSESLAATGTLTGSFSIPGLTVSSATLTPGDKIVHLVTSAQTVGANYTVTVKPGAVSDAIGNPGIAPYSATFLSGAVPILQISQGADAGRPTGRVYATHDATAVVDELLVAANGGPATVSTITVRGLDTVAALRTDVASVSLYRDNGDGVFSSADTRLSSSASFSADASGTALTFTSVGTVVVPNSPASLWVVFHTGSTPVDGHEVGSRLLNGDVAAANSTTAAFATVTSANSGQTIGIDTVAPSVPATAHANPTSTSSVEVTWTPSTDSYSGVSKYNIYRDGSLVGYTNSSVTTFTATGLNPGQTYSFSVSAVDAAGNESAQTPAVAVTVPMAALSMTITTPGPGQDVDLGSVDPGSVSTLSSGTTIQVGGVGATQYTLSASAIDFSAVSTSSATPSMPASVLSYVAHVGGGSTVGPVAFSTSPSLVYGASTGPYTWQQNFVFDYLMSLGYSYDSGGYTTAVTYTVVQR